MRGSKRSNFKMISSAVALAMVAVLFVPGTAFAIDCNVVLTGPASVVMSGTTADFTGGAPDCDLDSFEQVNVTGAGFSLTVELSGGSFLNTAEDEVPLVLSGLGALVINGTDGVDRINVGTEGANFDYRGAPELEFAALPTSITVNGGLRADRLAADGAKRTGDPLTTPVTLNGDAGPDRLIGGNGNDTLNGGTGADQLEGGPGSDTENGGDGKDRFMQGDTAQPSVTTPGTATFFADPADGFVQSSATALGGPSPSAGQLTTAYNLARAGNSLSVNPEGGGLSLMIGQQREGNGFNAREAFVSFNTEPLPNDATITSVDFSLFGLTGPSVPFTLEARAKAWGPTVETGDWVAGGSLGTTVPELATSNVVSAETGAYNFTESVPAFRDFINKTGTTEFMLNGNTLRTGAQPGASLTYERVVVASAESNVGPEGTDQDPKLVVNYETTAAGSPDTLDGGDGKDVVDYGMRTGDVTVDLAAGTGGEAGEGDSLANIENAAGGKGNDTLTGDGVNNVLTGRDGTDILTGADGTDRLFGGKDNDDLSGNAGRDKLFGGGGDDDLDGGDGVDKGVGGPGTDTCTSIEKKFSCEL